MRWSSWNTDFASSRIDLLEPSALETADCGLEEKFKEDANKSSDRFSVLARNFSEPASVRTTDEADCGLDAFNCSLLPTAEAGRTALISRKRSCKSGRYINGIRWHKRWELCKRTSWLEQFMAAAWRLLARAARETGLGVIPTQHE